MLHVLMCCAMATHAPDVVRTFPSTNHESNSLAFVFDPAALPDAPSLALLQEEAAPSIFGEEGSTYWLVNFGAGTTFEDEYITKGGVGISHFLADDFSIDLELNAAYFSQDGDDALGFNVNVLLRWHFWYDESKSWTMYADGGAGLMVSTNDVPATGSSFNFTPQLGVGMSFDLGDEKRLYVGAKWFHISNGRLFESNPGQDHLMLYAMLGWGF